jgi:mxaL protein
MFKRFFHYLYHRRDAALLAIALVLLLVAATKPTVPLPRNIYSYLLVVDITQSMNAKGMTWNGKEVSRLEYTKRMLHDTVATMPCGSRVSLALFAGFSVAALYMPIEVCANYAAIQNTIETMEWRMAWSGNSRLRDGVESIGRLLRTMSEPAQVIFFTDGEEAPLLHAFNTRDLSNFQGGRGWLIVGIGSEKAVPIPKLDEENTVIGYWSAENFQLQPGVAQISQQNFGNRDDNVAVSEDDRHPSRLDEKYLKELAEEINANYLRGDSLQKLKSAMADLKPARRDLAPMQIDWVLATIAAILIISAYTPQRLLHLFRRLRTDKHHRKASSSGKS